MLWRIAFVTVLLVVVSLGMFFWEQARGMRIEWARTASLNTLVAGEIVYLFCCRHLTDSSLTREGLMGNSVALKAVAALVALQIAMTHLPWMQTLFGTASLDFWTWLRVVFAGFLVLLAVESEKSFWRRCHVRRGG